MESEEKLSSRQGSGQANGVLRQGSGVGGIGRTDGAKVAYVGEAPGGCGQSTGGNLGHEADEEYIRALEQSLSERTRIWKSMPRGSEAARKEAEDFYDQEIMPLLSEVFTYRERSKVRKQYDLLILSLGFSYQPLALCISILKPRRVLFLPSPDTREFMDLVIETTKLKPSQYTYREVDPANTADIYQAVKEVYEEWGRPANVAVDPTGGTKAMAAGIAMAGVMIGADLVYVNSKYSPALRRPEPGSEHLTYLVNPYAVFGDLEEELALNLYREGDYLGAARIWRRLASRVPDPEARRCEMLSALCLAYEAWDNLDWVEAAVKMREFTDAVERFGHTSSGKRLVPFMVETMSRLRKQMATVELLKRYFEPDNVPSGQSQASSRLRHLDLEFLQDLPAVIGLVGSIYQNALRRERQGKLDMASLLFYRIVEMLAQRRLATYGIDTHEPNYDILPSDLLDRINQLCAAPKSGLRPFRQLPSPISLVESYVVLAALGDAFTEGLSFSRLIGKVNARNYNIFAHGFEHFHLSSGENEPREYRQFKELTLERLEAWARVEGIDWMQEFTQLQFVGIDGEGPGS